MSDAFHKVYEFIEVGYTGDKVYETIEAGGRLNVYSLYLTYVMREMRRSQEALPGFIRQNFGTKLPEPLLEVLRKYSEELTID